MMFKIQIEVQLAQADLKCLERWIFKEQFADIDDAIQCAVSTAVNQWQYDEAVKREQERYSGMSEKEFNKVIAAERRAAVANAESRRRALGRYHFVIGYEDEYIDQLDGIAPEDMPAPADEWLKDYEQR